MSEFLSKEQMPSGQADILVVDDDPMTCRLITLQLEMEGYVCEAVTEAKKVLKMIASVSPSMVLLDYHLGNLGGLDLLHAIRTHAEYNDLPIIIMSGLDLRRESESAGANGFVLKPFRPQDLVSKIQEVLDRRKPTG